MWLTCFPVVKGITLEKWSKNNLDRELASLTSINTEMITIAPVSGERWYNWASIGNEYPSTLYPNNEYKTLLLNYGFTLKRVELIPKKMEHAGIEALKGWIRTTWLPYTERVPEVERERFIEIVSKKYIERYSSNSKGIVNVQMIRLEVEAEKI